jgi:hypothetical protein
LFASAAGVFIVLVSPFAVYYRRTASALGELVLKEALKFVVQLVNLGLGFFLGVPELSELSLNFNFLLLIFGHRTSNSHHDHSLPIILVTDSNLDLLFKQGHGQLLPLVGNSGKLGYIRVDCLF